ncbi:MAG: ribonuclease J, partial [Desulfatiglandales bacterium]
MVKITPLGGVGEIGLNCFVLETEKAAIAIDAGLMFPDEHMPGIDIVIPDFTYLESIRDKIKALILTHGHEDHIGAAPFFLKNFDIPVYATLFTMALLKAKLAEHNIGYFRHTIVDKGEKLEFDDFRIEFISVVHSIVDCVGLAIETKDGIIVHSGDFKIDSHASEITDLVTFSRYGNKGVMLFLGDSTNAEKEGYSLSETTVKAKLEDIILRRTGRVFIAVFASNIPRIRNIFELAQKYGLKVFLDGKSMVSNVGIAKELGYLDFPKELILEERDLERHPGSRTVILTTGTQGEPMSALTRISHNAHRLLKITEGDTIVLSSRYIPGNEKAIHGLVNRLLRLGGNVFYEDISEVHTSGHAKREELRLLLQIVRPKYFMPVHGEQRHLVKHSELALELGIPRENILLIKDGDSLSFEKGLLVSRGEVPHGRVFVDGKGVGDVEEMVLRDRRRLSTEGVTIVLIVVDS